MATATRPPPVNRGYYAESSQARVDNRRLRTHTAHIHFLRIIDGGLFQIAMAQQDLNGAQIRARF